MNVHKIKNALNNCIDSLTACKELFVRIPGTDFSRERRLPFSTMIRLFLEMQSKALDKELLEFFDYSIDKIPSQSAFSQQRSKILPDAFRFLFWLFNEEVPFEKQLDGYHLVAVDGSNINISFNSSDTETFIQPENDEIRGHNALHLNAFYHLLERRYINASVQPCHQMDEKRALCDALNEYNETDPRKTIIIADRGYFSYNVMANLSHHGFYYLIRAKDIFSSSGTLKTYPEIPKEENSEFDLWLERYLTRSQKQAMLKQNRVYKNIDSAIPFDYLDKKHTLYYMKFRVVRFQLSDNSYETLVTNLPECDFPPEKLKQLYHLRWGIETSFRDLKLTIGLSRLHGKRKEFAEQEIFARLTLYNFCEAIVSQVVLEKAKQKSSNEKPKKYDYQINRSRAIDICRRFLKTLNSGKPIDVERLMLKYVIPVRPDRHYKRNMKGQGFVAFTYRVA